MSMKEEPEKVRKLYGERGLLKIYSGKTWYPYHWSVGRTWSKFFRELRDNERILGLRCPECETVYMPPRSICPKCFVKMDDWVEVGKEGTIEGYTVVEVKYINPNTGKPIETPRTDVMIRLDGADTKLFHELDETDEKKIKIGMRARAVFAKDRNGSIHDIDHFELVKE